MTRIAQVAAVALLVAYWALGALGSQFAIDPPGVLYDLWYSAVPLVLGLGLAFGVGLFAGRWWALAAALTPVLVFGALELAGHRSPWHDSGPPLTQYGWFPVVWWTFWFYVLPLGLGIALRRGLGERGSNSASQRGPGTPLNS